MTLLMHNSGRYVSLDDLRQVPLPEETESYKPVSHYDLAINLDEVSQGLLRDYELANSQHGLARNGQQMFGIHSYRKEADDTMGLSIGFRNSYDKSMSVAIAIGASVFVCDNLALTGEIAILRKHITNVWRDLEDLIIATIYRSQHNFHTIMEDAQYMQSVYLMNDDAFRMIGLLYGRQLLTPRQLPVVKREWLKPKHDEFQQRNVWSFYNSCTEALKSCRPNKIMEKHIKLHEILTNTWTGGRDENAIA